MNYWLAGAVLDNEDYMGEYWVPWGVWMVYYRESQRRVYDWADQIRGGDRIALRTMASRNELLIRHIGVVKGWIYGHARVASTAQDPDLLFSAYAVDWIPADLNRIEPMKGLPAFGAGRGRLSPLGPEHERTKRIFGALHRE